MKKEELVWNFIEDFDRKEDILGIIFYGSSCYKTDMLGSDIDLLFITGSDKNYKGTTYIDGIKIEYFLKNIYDLMEKFETLPSSFDRSLISIFQNGQVLYSKDKTVEYLKEEIFSVSKIFPTKRKKKCYELDFVDFYEQIQLLNFKDETYSYVYYNLIESIRKRYHEEGGYSKLPSMKIYPLYMNSNYAEEFYCVRLPDKFFRDHYIEMVTSLKEQEQIKGFMQVLNCSIEDYDKDSNSKRYYSKVELKYLSTIVKNMVDKTVCYLKTNHPFTSSCYYVTLDKIRRLYCYMNKLEDKFSLDNEEYDIRFLELFHLCISNPGNAEYLEQLFYYVVESLQMDYQNYKILERSFW